MYDVAIIGGGPAAIFAAYEFVLKYPQLKVIMLEAGNTIEKRYAVFTNISEAVLVSSVILHPPISNSSILEY